MNKDEIFLTVVDTSRLLKLRPNTIYKHISSGQLGCVRTKTGSIRIRQTDLEAFLTPARPKKKKGGRKHGH